MTAFSARLASLGFASYAAYLQSPHWLAFTAKRRSVDGRCRVCKKRPVDIHHVTYVRLGAERAADVVPLCREHHEAVHAWLDANHAPVERTPEAIALLSGCKPDETQAALAELRRQGDVPGWVDQALGRMKSTRSKAGLLAALARRQKRAKKKRR